MPVYSNWHERVWLHHSKAQEMHTYLGFRTETARRKGCLFELHELKCHLQETQRDDCPHLVMDFTPWTFNRHSGTKEEAELLGSKIGCSLLGTPLAAAPHLTVRFRRPTDNYSPTQEEDCFWSTLLKTGCFKATSITLRGFPGGLPKTLLTVQREFGPIKKFHLSAPYAQRRNFTYVLQSGMGLRQNEVETLFAIIAANRYSMKELTLRNLMFYDQATTTEFLEAARPLQRMIANSPEIDTLNIEPPWYYFTCNDTLRSPSRDRRNGLVEVNAYHVGHMDRGRQGERYARIKLLTAPMKVPVTSVGYQTWANLLVNSAPRLDDIYNLVRERPEFLSSLADTVLGDPSFQKVEMKKALREPPRKDDYEMPQVVCSRRIRRKSPSWYGFYVRGPSATLHLGQSEITDSRLPLEESLDRLTVHCSYEEISVYPDEDGWDDPANYSSFFGNADQEDVNVVKRFLRAIIGKGTKKFEIGFGKGDHEFEDFRIAAILRMLPARLEHLVINNIDATHPKVFAALRRFRNLKSLRLTGPPENFMGHLHFVKLHPNCDILISRIEQVLRSLRKSQSLESFTIYNLPMERFCIDSEGFGPYQYNKDQIDEDSARVRWLHGDRKQILGRIEKELVKHLHLKFVRLKVCVYVDQIDKYFPMESRLNGHCSRQLKTPTCEPLALFLKGNKLVPEPETSMIWMPKTRTNGSKRPPASVPASSGKKPRANKPATRLKRPPDSSPTLPTKKPCYRTVASLDTRTPAPSLKRNADVAGAALPAPRSFENFEQSSQPSEQSSKPSVLDIKERAILNIKPKKKVHETGLTPSDLYTADILEWMFVKEEESAYPYMSAQPEMTPFKRAIVVNWLAHVQETFQMARSSLYTAVAIMDRYLKKPYLVTTEKIQLLGITSFMIACKMEEVCPPTPKDCAWICDDIYEKNCIVTMERNISEALEYRLYFPTSFSFMVYFLDVLCPSKQQTEAANYYLELTTTQYTFLATKPSLLAAAAVFLAIVNKHFTPKDRKGLTNSTETSNLVDKLLLCSRASKWSICETAEEICDLIEQRFADFESKPHSVMNSIKKKYLHVDKLGVAADSVAPTVADFRRFFIPS